MNETTWSPLIISAAVDPSPALAFKPIRLTVLVVDVFGQEQEDVRISGEYQSGEV